MQNNAKNINSNYVMMSIPYIGIFADGAEQWCKKIGLNAPRFNDEEKEYYEALKDQVESEYNSSKQNSISYFSGASQLSSLNRYMLGI